jgi:hypothetical protein
MTFKLTTSAGALAELHALPDDALLRSNEAAAFLNVSINSLSWYRCQRMGPEYLKLGAKSVRYRVGALRAYTASLRPGVGRPKAEG